VTGTGNGVWKAIALAVLASLISGVGAAMLMGWQRVGPLEQRMSAQESTTQTWRQDTNARLDRIENKLDQLLERRRP